ncbi:universal stress protein [Olivibacter domesticus]|uniref:Nucleotide-binding universal stress protein, UspA family n=1 Tax=Olivibacter domesticus TaxID=407022 RepID=A0A1H7L488_OLID1|nr:universal stress protein [Olivibacter domesticus]SEK93883.1 hypothetical protein SAMN05661044_01553 [Olivibacter domesticus]
MISSNTVLVPVDLTEQTKEIATEVLNIAQNFSWAIYFVHPFSQEEISSERDPDQSMEELLTSMRTIFSNSMIQGEAVQGDLSDVVVNITATEEITLIILVHDDIKNLQYSTVVGPLSSLMEKCSTPILTIPDINKLKNLRHIGLMSSFHPSEIESLQVVDDLFNHLIAIIAFHIYTKNAEQVNAQMQQWELDVAGNVSSNNFKFITYHADDVLSGVESVITAYHLDLLVITSIAKSFIETLFSKNILKEFINHPLITPTLFIKCS